MRAFLYYATHSLLNTIKKLMKTWVAIILVMFLCFGLIGGITALVDNIQEGKAKETAVTEVDDKDVVVSDDDGDVIAEYEFNTGKKQQGIYKRRNSVRRGVFARSLRRRLLRNERACKKTFGTRRYFAGDRFRTPYRGQKSAKGGNDKRVGAVPQLQ